MRDRDPCHERGLIQPSPQAFTPLTMQVDQVEHSARADFPEDGLIF
jgi:hypothetical protein